MPLSDDGERVNMLFGALIYLNPKLASIPSLGLTKKPPMVRNPAFAVPRNQPKSRSRKLLIRMNHL
jgi:hypothetical protein